jgi:hypothetical protein
MEIGLHRGLTYAQYHAIDAINQSKLKLFRKSPAHVREEILRPSPDRDARALGRYMHSAILEPEVFEAEFIGAPKVDRRTKEGKATWAEFNAEHSDKTVLKQEEFDACRIYAEKCWEDETACELLKGKGINEGVGVWEDPTTEVLCKLRFDRLTEYAGYPTIVELKTARSYDASPKGFARAIDKFDYHLQAAWYLDGLNEIAPMERRHVFLMVEKDPPYCVCCYELDLGSLELAREEYDAYLAVYKQCMETGVWPGYPTGIQPISLPPWRFKRLEE